MTFAEKTKPKNPDGDNILYEMNKRLGRLEGEVKALKYAVSISITISLATLGAILLL